MYKELIASITDNDWARLQKQTDKERAKWRKKREEEAAAAAATFLRYVRNKLRTKPRGVKVGKFYDALPVVKAVKEENMRKAMFYAATGESIHVSVDGGGCTKRRGRKKRRRRRTKRRKRRRTKRKKRRRRRRTRRRR